MLAFLIGFMSPVMGQERSQEASKVAREYVQNNLEKYKLTQPDIAAMAVSDQYESRHNGVTHVYFVQKHRGIEVQNAIYGVHIKNGKVAYSTSRFIPNLAEKVNAIDPQLTAYESVERAAAYLGLIIDAPLRQVQQTDPFSYRFEGGNIAQENIPVNLRFQPDAKTGAVRLAWIVGVYEAGSPDYWNLSIDALTGQLLARHNLTLHCSFPAGSGHAHNLACALDEEKKEKPVLTPATMLSGATYNVFPLPYESPLDGDRQLVIEPADPTASPFGWHDTDGAAGPEYTITRGNNVHAFLDRDDTNQSSGDEPDGTNALLFDFPLDVTEIPDSFQQAATVQLFYTVNMMHDFAYRYGFDEPAGNFQQNNYSNGGAANDYVQANAQDGANELDADHINNANFFTPADGSRPRVQMYLWEGNNGGLFTILQPEGIAGTRDAGTAVFGPAIGATPIEGKIAPAFDGTSSGSLACQNIVNVAEVAGNIALVDRGNCFFHEKALKAQAAGAIALIICNFEETIINMAEIANLPDVTIPTVMLKRSDCIQILNVINAGEDVRIRLASVDATGPEHLDGDLESVIVGHEFAHGISNRLTGGPSRADCLQNEEQMGEGWSDFFGMVVTAKPGQTGEMPRGVGSYVWGGGLGTGFRTLPYSTDMSVNTKTYDDVIGQGVHALGEVWLSALWDLYWELVEIYGFDEDFIHGTGGNNMAIQLVMDGMKLQPCLPGLIDGRNAILAADFLNYDGAHECLIWEVFARRGLGWSADQGSSTDNGDNRQAFDTMPECIKELKITKEVNKPNIEPGEQVTYSLMVTNHTDETLQDVTVTDEFPQGAVYVAGSASAVFPFSVAGGTITWEIGELLPDQFLVLSYKVNTDPGLSSQSIFVDDFETFSVDWFGENLDNNSTSESEYWQYSDLSPRSGDFSWFVDTSAVAKDMSLMYFNPITVSGDQPVLRFWHRYNTEPVFDGGIVQISTNLVDWFTLDSDYLRNGYRGKINYSAFAIPNAQAFWGNSAQYIDSYIDLTEYKGQDIYFRFRFGSDAEAVNTIETGEGWYVDDVEIMDMVNYQTEACVSATGAATACAKPAEAGTVVEPNAATAVSELENLDAVVNIFPNPAKEELFISMDAGKSGKMEISLLSVDGRMVTSQLQSINQGRQRFTLDVSNLPAGFYFVRLNTGNEVVTQKVVIE